MKKRGHLAELMRFAGRHRYLTYASWVLSAVSAALALVLCLTATGCGGDVSPTQTPESTAVFSSIPVPTTGASVSISGTA